MSGSSRQRKLALWFLRRRFLKFVNVFSLFRYYLPLEKGVALHLNKLESPSPKDALSQVWLKLAQWFLRRRFLKFVNVFSLFPYYLPLENNWGPSFEQTWIPFTQGYFVPSLVEFGPVVLEKMKMWKVYRQTDRQTDGLAEINMTLPPPPASFSPFFINFCQIPIFF